MLLGLPVLTADYERLDDDVRVQLPSLPDLRRTKRFAARAKDLEDLRLIDALIAERTS